MSGFASSSAHIRSTWRLPSSASATELDVDDASDRDLADVEAQLAQRGLRRLPLRVEDAGLRPDDRTKDHKTTSGSAR